MIKKSRKFTYYSIGSLGLIFGLFISFFITVYLLNEKFDKPWDVIWTGLFGLFGTIAGGVIGGLTAFFIVKLQMDNDKNRQIEHQRKISKRVINEIVRNRELVEKIHNILPDTDEKVKSVAESIASGNKPIVDALTMLIDTIEIEYIRETRLELTDDEFIMLHEPINILLRIKNSWNRLTDLNDSQLIMSSLKRIKRYCKELLDLTQKLNI